MTYADTSFLASAYGGDSNTELARQFIRNHDPRLPFTFLHWPEITRALWIGHPEVAEQFWELVEEDLSHGQKLYLSDLDADAVARRAAGLMRNYCPRWKKLRSLDTMHVSAAVTGHFKTFVSFDSGSYQRVLAHVQKLSVWPPLTAEEKRHLK
jgi:predicted nucleic acid-binding protein